MSELKLLMDPKPNSIEEFIDNIKFIENAFHISKINKNEYLITLKFKYHNLLIHSASPAVSCVKGIVDESVIGNAEPTIKTSSTFVYKFIQIVIIAFGVLGFITSLTEWDSFILIYVLIVLLLLAFNYGFYKFGEALFKGKLIEEIEKKGKAKR